VEFLVAFIVFLGGLSKKRVYVLGWVQLHEPWR